MFLISAIALQVTFNANLIYLKKYYLCVLFIYFFMCLYNLNYLNDFIVCFVHFVAVQMYLLNLNLIDLFKCTKFDKLSMMSVT